jgi:hypothetical protein
MELNLSQLIKSCGTETHPATKTQSIRLPAYAQLSLVFAEPLRQLYHDPRLAAVNRDSSIYQDSPIWTALSGQRNFQPSTGTLPGPTSSRPSTGIVQKLMPARCGRQLPIPPGR